MQPEVLPFPGVWVWGSLTRPQLTCLPSRAQEVKEPKEPRGMGELRAWPPPQKASGSPKGAVRVTLTTVLPNRTPAPPGPQTSLSGNAGRESRGPRLTWPPSGNMGVDSCVLWGQLSPAVPPPVGRGGQESWSAAGGRPGWALVCVCVSVCMVYT